MIIFVVVAPNEESYVKTGGDFDLKRRFEKISGEPCLVLHHFQVSRPLINDLNPKAMILSGFGSSFENFDIKTFYSLEQVVKEMEVPILAICGSHQLLGFMYNLDLHSCDKLRDEPMRRLRAGEPDISNYHPGYFKEEGFYPVSIVKEDPIFEGLPNPFIVRESHYCEVKKLPSEFLLLASTEECLIQAMRHKEKIIYGTQFHPEGYTEFYPHGRLILQNFFRIAFGA